MLPAWRLLGDERAGANRFALMCVRSCRYHPACVERIASGPLTTNTATVPPAMCCLATWHLPTSWPSQSGRGWRRRGSWPGRSADPGRYPKPFPWPSPARSGLILEANVHRRSCRYKLRFVSQSPVQAAPLRRPSVNTGRQPPLGSAPPYISGGGTISANHTSPANAPQSRHTAVSALPSRSGWSRLCILCVPALKNARQM